MKIGACGKILSEKYDMVAELGYDYYEVDVRTVVNESDEEVQKMLDHVKEKGLPVETANGLFFTERHFFGEDAMSLQEVEEYIGRAFPKLKKLGVKIVVYGSGYTRGIPEFEDKIVAVDKLEKIAAIICDEAQRCGLTVVIEPLERRETNVYNSVQSAYDFAKKFGRKELTVLADSFHMMAESEPYASLKDKGDLLKHAHIADAVFGRNDWRKTPHISNENNVKEFVDVLREMGYEGRISVESGLRTNDWRKDFADALEALREWTK